MHALKPFLAAPIIFYCSTECFLTDIIRRCPTLLFDIPYCTFLILDTWIPLYKCVADQGWKAGHIFFLYCYLIPNVMCPLLSILRMFEVILFKCLLARFRRRIAANRRNDVNNNNNNRWNNHGNNQNGQHVVEIHPANPPMMGRRPSRQIDHGAAYEAVEFAPSAPPSSETDPLGQAGRSESTMISMLDHRDSDPDVEPGDYIEYNGRIEGYFLYGMRKEESSFTDIFAAGTKFISSGFIHGIQDEICVICYDNFMKGQKCARLNCGHLFHRNCCKKWLETKSSC